MELESFVHDLHYDVDKTKPLDWEVDWDDKPLPYKLYRGVPSVSLPADIPLTLEASEEKETRQPDLRTLGHFLWYTYGLAQLSHSVPLSLDPELGLFRMNRRFAPSGGALYPNELYLYLNIRDLPAGVYHYDTAHHRLVLLREGRLDRYIARALGGRCEIEGCFGVAFVTAMFWKNFFKYNYFSYRLQGLDAGAMMGQLLESAKRFNFETGVYYQFLDRAVNRLLGLSEQEESVYAVVPLSTESSVFRFAGQTKEQEAVTAQQLCSGLPPIRHDHYVRSRTIKEFPLLIRMNEASMLHSMPDSKLDSKHDPMQPVESVWEISRRRNLSAEGTVPLPVARRLSYDFAAACRNRYSPDSDFVMGSLELNHLAELLSEATSSFEYRNDLDGAREQEREHPVPRVTLYGIVHNVDGLPDGAYRYDSAEHALQRLRPGDLRLWVQQGMPSDNVNVLQVPLCLHVVGDRHHLMRSLRYRGYRIQQMEAGMLTQRVLLSAAATGLGGHPLLGYDARLCDELYRLPAVQQASLIQIPVGWPRPGPRLTGALHG